MRYTKMHGAGNSFLITENLRGELQGEDLSVLALRLCSEKTGPGADGFLVLAPASDADFAMLFFNADGSQGEMCGNGARCAARYGWEHGLARDPACIRIRATAGLVTGRRISETQYEVRLNDPPVIELHRSVPLGDKILDCAYVELGRPGIPHAVEEVPAEAFADWDALRERGRALRHSPVFPRGANVTFACLLDERTVRAVTFERGVEDFTLACGTGCGATAACLILRGRIPGESAAIRMPGGELSVRLTREGNTVHDIFLTGPTALVEEGEYIKKA